MINLAYNGKNFTQRPDGYVNLGELCATHAGKTKQFSNWSRTQSAQEYLEALAETLSESQSSFMSNDLVVTTIGGAGGSQTWGHPLVAIEVARWINSKFGVWCNIHIRTLVETGSVSLYRPDHRLDPDWQKERQDGKDVRRSLTDATKAWIERNCPDLKDWEKRMIYAEHSDALNVALFGRTAKELIEYFDCKKNKLRDQFTKQEINALRSLEWMAIRLVDIDNLHPVKAVHEAVKLCLAKGMFVDHHTEPLATPSADLLPPSEPKAKQKRVAKAKAPKALPTDNGQLNLFG